MVIGALSVGGAPMLQACKGLVRMDFGDAPSDGPRVDTRLQEVLALASLAPSGHNTQPWTIRVLDPRRLILGTEPSRHLPAVDPDGREMFLSLGAFLENFIVAAAHHGWAVRYDVRGASRMDLEVAEITLSDATPVAYPLDRIRTRRTVRSNHLVQALRPQDLAVLSKPYDGRLTVFDRGSAGARQLVDATIEANRLQADRDDAQRELSQWIRFSDADGRAHRNGLTPESMELHGVKGFYVRHFSNADAVMSRRFRDAGVDAAREQAQQYGAWLVVSSADSSTSALLDTGRRWQRMLLELRARNIAVHPMTQLLEEPSIRAAVIPSLTTSGGVPQFVLRTSYLKTYPDPVSLRMPLSAFVTVAP